MGRDAGNPGKMAHDNGMFYKSFSKIKFTI